jgi:hypothetical protein
MHTVGFDDQASHAVELERQLGDNFADSKKTWAEEKQQMLDQVTPSLVFLY